MNAQDLIKLYDQLQAMKKQYRAALDEFVTERAEFKIGADVKPTTGHAFRVEKIASQIEDNRGKSYTDGVCVRIQYDGKRLKANGQPHATAGGYGWQTINLSSEAISEVK